MVRHYVKSATRSNAKNTKVLDALFSEYIRKRAIARVGGCERCLTPKFDIQKDNGDVFPAWKQLQCSHFHGRAKKSTRFDEDNCIGICGACHLYLTAHPLEHVEFFKQRFGGDKFDMLNSRMRDIQKPDKELLTLYYKQKLEEILRC